MFYVEIATRIVSKTKIGALSSTRVKATFNLTEFWLCED